MGFFKFLKRDNNYENEAELDLPPAPPPLEGFEDDKDANLPEFPHISAPKDDDFNFDFPEDDKLQDMGKEDNFPELPDFDDLGKEPPAAESVQTPMPYFPRPEQFRQPMSPTPEPMPKQVEMGNDSRQYMQDLNQPPVPQQANPAPSPAHQTKHRWQDRTIRSGGSLYVRVDKFKTALDHINLIRSDLRKSEADVMKLESLKHEKDKSFDRFKSSLDDLQKKLIFVDKTLFKGE